MPGPYREEETFVGSYRRRGGALVGSHRSHALIGTPVFVVLYRRKDRRLPGGTREDPRNARYRWRVHGRYRTETAASRARRRLMSKGYHAQVEEIGGRSPNVSNADLAREANASDRRRSAMRE